MRAQAGQRGDLAVNALGLGVIGDAEGDGVVVGRGLKVAMLRRAKTPCLTPSGSSERMK